MSIERSFHDLTEDAEQKRIWAFALRERGGLTWDDVLMSKRVLLVTEAGAGKTFECQRQAERLWNEGEAAFYLDMAGLKDNSVRELLSAEQEARFDKWLASQSDTATFFLDSIDELELTLGKFEAALARFAKPLAGHLQRVRVIITSRPVAIDETIFRRQLPIPPAAESRPTSKDFADIAMSRKPEKEAPEMPPEWRNVGLMPLTPEQIREMAALQGISDVDAFVADIHRRDAEDFARRPQDLIELCADWLARQEIRTHADQIASNVAVKLQPRTDRPEKSDLSETRALEGAQRLALASLLARNLTIRHSAAADAQAEGGALEPAKVLPDWTANERSTLLERPLFGFATYGRVRFHHRSVVEFLAAEELYSRLQRGMPRASVRRLLFAETAQGNVVVRPSMRSVAAWLARRRDDIFEYVRDTDPSVLINFGDPAALRPQQRIQTLRAYVARYGAGGWRGLDVPHLQIHRFAAPELGPELQQLWAEGIENTEVRQVLLQLVEAAKLQEGADIAFSVAEDGSSPFLERIFALDALIALRDPRLVALSASVEADRTLWPNKIARTATHRLFPAVMPADQLCRALSTITEPKQSIAELSYHFPETIDHSDLTVDQLEGLRSGLDALVSPGIKWNETVYRPVTDRRDLLPMLAATCLRLWKTDSAPSAPLIASTIHALRLISSDMTRGAERRTELRSQLQGAAKQHRAEIFWADDRFMMPLHPERDRWRRFHDVAFQGQLDLSIERDWEWLCEAITDAHRLTDERGLALETALWLARVGDAAERENRIEVLRGLVGDQASLVAQIDAEKSEPDPKWAEMQAKHEERQSVRQAEEDAAHQTWVAFWHEIAEAPEKQFSSDRSENTVWNLWRAMARTGDQSRSTGWNRRFIEDHFGSDVADRMRLALMKRWRAEVPTVRSERSAADKSTYLVRWELGLAAISAEAEDSDWATKLCDVEAQMAARYAPVELNGFPSWLDSLSQVHPEAVDAVLGNELSAELEEPLVAQSHSIMLQNLSHSAPATVALFIPRLLKWFREKGGRWTANEDPSAAAVRLSNVLDVLVKHGNADVRLEIRHKAEAELASGTHDALAAVWLTVLLELDPKQGVAAFERVLAPLPIEANGEAVAWFSGLFGRHGSSTVNLSAHGYTPDLLLRLVRLAYTHVRIGDDAHHEGMFSPDTRDDAETGRNNVLNALLSLRGESGWEAKIALANDPLAAHLRDRLVALAEESSAEEADGTALSDEQLGALDRFGEAPPATRDAMFALMRDRLDDLDDLLLQDISPREVWATTKDEHILRRGIAHELRSMANRCYTVDQESVTADEKETDIRLRSTVSEQQGTIELKVGESWSGNELRSTLRNQLVERYMAAEACRSGCLLITVASGRQWRHPDTGAPMSFSELIDYLNGEAASLVEEFGGAIRLLVKGLDLRRRLK